MTSALTHRRRSLAAGVRSVCRQSAPTYRVVHVLPIVAVPAAAGVLLWRTRADVVTIDVLLASAVAVGLAPVLADRAANITDATPTSRWWRASARLVVVVPALLVWWMVRALSLRAVTGATVLQMPGWDAALLAATFVVTAIAIDVAADPQGARAGVTGAVAALLGIGIVARLPQSIALLPVADNRVRWIGTLAVATTMLAMALVDRGRARRGPRPRAT